VFSFSKHFNFSEINNNRNIIKLDTFSNKVVFVNGFSASGKTMVSPIISSIDNTESTIYPYEIEWVASLLYAQQISEKGFIEFVRQYCDHSIYNQMMSRNVNFRIGDVSSVCNKKDFLKYFFRLFKKGDNFIPKIIEKKQPISCYTTSHLIFFVNEIFQALKDRCLFIETVRDPIYMFKQIKILFTEVYKENPKKLFSFMAESKKKHSLFFDFFSDEDVFVNFQNMNNINSICVNYLERIFSFYFNLDFKKINPNKSLFILLPFEKFVVKPEQWTEDILTFLKKSKSKNFLSELKKQNVPRKILTDGIKRQVYQRYGYETNTKSNLSFADADSIYISEIKKIFNNQEFKDFEKLISISKKYRSWISNFSKFTF
jgi:hypothetical protein